MDLGTSWKRPPCFPSGSKTGIYPGNDSASHNEHLLYPAAHPGSIKTPALGLSRVSSADPIRAWSRQGTQAWKHLEVASRSSLLLSPLSQGVHKGQMDPGTPVGPGSGGVGVGAGPAVVEVSAHKGPRHKQAGVMHVTPLKALLTP